jgi:hypothetical protein
MGGLGKCLEACLGDLYSGISATVHGLARKQKPGFIAAFDNLSRARRIASKDGIKTQRRIEKRPLQNGAALIK